jgi:hypothetical protein
MSDAIANYFRTLFSRTGAAWNRFWFTPSDPAVLGLLRVLVGLVAIYLHVTFTPDLTAFFGADGLLTPQVLEPLQTDQQQLPWTSWSYLNYFQTPGELHVVHYAGLAVLGLFTIGVFTRVTSVLALVVVLSYFHRGIVLTGEAEPILAFLMFYLCLGPSGRWLSVDAWRNARKSAGRPGAGVATATWGANVAIRLIQVHVSLVYLMIAVAMTMGGPIGVVWWQGEALWWLIAKPQTPLVDFTWLNDNIYLINLWTLGTLAYMFAFGVFGWSRLVRPLLMVVGVPVWGLLALVTGLVPFCALMLIGNLAFVSGAALRGCCRRAEQAPAPLAEPRHSQKRIPVAAS